MKTFGKALALVILLALLMSMSAGAFADDTTYQVRIYAGNQGEVDGEDVFTTTVKAGEKLSFDLSLVSVSDDKYYARGIREAGLDNALVYAGDVVSVTINEDTDFVVAFGTKSTAVKYTVQYQDTAKNKLANDKVYYGNVGDKPVVAFLYLEGYVPQAYNLTKTLSATESDNVFTFTYSQLPTVVVPAVQNNNQNANNQNANNQNANNQNAAGTAQNTAGNDQNNAAANQGSANQSGVSDGGASGAGDNQNSAPTSPPEPEEIIDLDVPQAGFTGSGTDDGSSGANASSSVSWTVITISAVFLAGLAVLVALLLKKKKNDEQSG